MKKSLYSGAMTLLLVGAIFVPHAQVEASTNLLSQIQSLMERLQSLQSNHPGLKGLNVASSTLGHIASTTASSTYSLPKPFNWKDTYKSPDGFTIAPGLSASERARLKLCLDNPKIAQGDKCIKLMKELKAYIIDPVDYNVKVVIENKATTTVTFTYKGKDYKAVSPRDNNGHIFAAVVKALGVKRVNDIDPYLRLDIQRKIAEVKTGFVTRAVTKSSTESAITNAEKEIKKLEDLIKVEGTSTSTTKSLVDAKALVASAKTKSAEKKYSEARILADKAKKLANETIDDITERAKDEGDDADDED